MGLDSVEIILEIENAFNIKLPDKECEKVRTVGNLQNLVLKYVGPSKNSECISSFVFYRLRKSFTGSLKIPRNAFIPALELHTVFSVESRRDDWKRIENVSGFAFPKLEKPEWYTNIEVYSILASLVILIISFFLDDTKLILLAVISFWLLIYFCSLLTEPLRKFLPVSNIRDLVNRIAAINYKTFLDERTGSESDIKTIVAFIIAEKAGLELEEVTPEKNIVDDLGIDS